MTNTKATTAKAKATPKAKAPAPILPGKSNATRHARTLLSNAVKVRESAHQILADTGMIKGDAWQGLPEGFKSLLAVAKAITPQPLPKGPTVLYVEPRKRAGITDRELRYSKDVHTVADALTKVSVEYGRPEGTSKGSRSATDKGQGKAKAPALTVETAKAVTAALTGKSVKVRQTLTAQIADGLEILAARGTKDERLLKACEAYVAAFTTAKAEPAKATPKASRPSMPGSQIV